MLMVRLLQRQVKKDPVLERCGTAKMLVVRYQQIMTRVLSQLLGAEPVAFGEQVQQLEKSSGHPNADIRLTADLVRQTQSKIRELRLDPQDTTGQELYGVLIERLKADEQRVRAMLGLDSGASAVDITKAVAGFVSHLNIPKNCFALKHTAAKKLFKALPPVQALKKLGYRSLDSALKREPLAQLYAVAQTVESKQWRVQWLGQYQNLISSDFESHEIEVLQPTTKQWATLAPELSGQYKSSCLALIELGAVILLPVAADLPAVTLLSLLFSLQHINAIRSVSAYLKLQQVRPDFGQVLSQTLQNGAYTGATLGGQALPWRLLQRYWSEAGTNQPEIFEPHLQAEDLSWRQAEVELAAAVPALEFWADSSALGLVDGDQTVSLNLFDVALSLCNRLSFGQRVSHFLQGSVWHELLLHYLKSSEAAQSNILGQLDHQLVGQEEMAEV